jgi:chromosome segregation ATPase
MNNEDKILAILEKHSVLLETVVTDVAGLKEGQVRLEERQARLETEVAGLKTEVAGLKTEVAGLNTEVAGLNTEVTGLKTEVAGINTEVTGLTTEVAGLKERFILMENDNKLKFGALYDNNVVILDYIKEIRADVADIKLRQENQQHQITWLDSRAVKKTS